MAARWPLARGFDSEKATGMMDMQSAFPGKSPYEEFLDRFELFAAKNRPLLATTLSNIFTMRLIGNKTHGDLAEVAISEFINQYMYDYRSKHVGKDLFRSKQREEDILVSSELTGEDIPISLKAYGAGPLQLSTDKDCKMFPRLEAEECPIADGPRLKEILSDDCFVNYNNINVLPLVYDEDCERCNIMVFDYGKAMDEVAKIIRLDSGQGRKHPVYRFFSNDDSYICEVRYGGAAANALQRGLWTHTANAARYFRSISGGWIDYSHNLVLVELLAKAMVGSEAGHKEALKQVENDIERIKRAGV